ncbi:MAG: hypothetical protein NTU61_06230 [Candidatus Altiarchaeota archaeon]|nr:hypothetical protein [Candidatus Altiarchaeota archaeon]
MLLIKADFTTRDMMLASQIIAQHPKAGCEGSGGRMFTIEENGDGMLLLGRLFRKFPEKIHVFKVGGELKYENIPARHRRLLEHVLNEKGNIKPKTLEKHRLDWEKLRNERTGKY